MKTNPALKYIRELKETRDIKEAAQMLSTGAWIAIDAAPLKEGGYLFVLGFVGSGDLDGRQS